MPFEETLNHSVSGKFDTLTLTSLEGAESVSNSAEYLKPILEQLVDCVTDWIDDEPNSLKLMRETACSKQSPSTAQRFVNRCLIHNIKGALVEFLFETPAGLRMTVEQLCSASSILDLDVVLVNLLNEDDQRDEVVQSDKVNKSDKDEEDQKDDDDEDDALVVSMDIDTDDSDDKETAIFDSIDDARATRSNLKEAVYRDDNDRPRLHFDKLSKKNVERIIDEYANTFGGHLVQSRRVEAVQRPIGKSIFSNPYIFTIELLGDGDRFYKISLQVDLLPPKVRSMKETLVTREADKLLTYMLEAKVRPADVHSKIKQMEIPKTLVMDIEKEFDTLRRRYYRAKAARSKVARK